MDKISIMIDPSRVDVVRSCRSRTLAAWSELSEWIDGRSTDSEQYELLAHNLDKRRQEELYELRRLFVIAIEQIEYE